MFLKDGYEHKDLLDEAHKEASVADMIGYTIDKMNEYGIDCYGQLFRIKGVKYKVTIEQVE